MSEFSDKINDLLSNPETLDKIMQIAKGMGVSNDVKTQPADAVTNAADTVIPTAAISGSTPVASSNTSALSSLLSSGNILSALGSSSSGTDKRVVLLNAIRPFMTDVKQKRVDNVISAITISNSLGKMKGG
ncbi:MAG: hypothetical protein A2Y17_10095 [Clostridiales bacterium GWF2_38_85]|nr:MAG: hypothetical protein A2Y17_10095 [Clostridiales bacterium GWF2_38_85]HBL84468.1 hypothetical protein [Clostridiales bacterium]